MRSNPASVVLAALVVIVGCVDSSPLPPAPSRPAIRSPAATAGPSGAVPGDVAPGSPDSSAPAGPRAAEDEGLRLTVELGPTTVEPGGRVAVTARLENERDVPVEIGSGWCGTFVDASARFAIPSDPPGRTWDGIAGDFKTFALREGLAPGGAPADSDVVIHAVAGPGCPDPGSRTLAPGATATIVVGLEAGLVPGIPAPVGTVPIQVTVAHDPDPPPTNTPAPGRCCVGSWVQGWRELTVTTAIHVEGPAPRVLSIGEAIDALLSDARFSGWLETMPKSTWSVSNVFLEQQPAAEGILPAGAWWDIELFREVGVPRNWAIGFVDPLTGEVRNLTFCNVPCDR